MNLLSKITSKKYLPFLLIFIALHVVLLNVNSAEWGDSYRILRAAEFIKDGAYPDDEKRPILYSAVLSLHPEGMDAVLFGRLVMLVISVLSLIVFVGLVEHFISEDKTRYLAILLFIFNPVYLYWSLRLMADVPFTLLVLSVLYFLTIWKPNFNFGKASLLGLLVGIAILTRFEGYLLFASVLVGIFFSNGFHRDFIKIFISKAVYVFSFLLGVFTILLPYFYYRNPLTSSYFEEPAGREYDLRMVWIYVVSLLFVLGVVPAVVFIKSNYKNVANILFRNPGVFTFILMELLLVLVWPAAVPRLFVPIIPFLIIFFALSAEQYFYDESTNVFLFGLFMLLTLLLYIASQYFLKLQFLLVGFKIMGVISVLQLVLVAFAVFKRYKLFVFSAILSCVVWSFLIIWAHKDILKTIKYAAEYAGNHLEGRIAHNDISAVSNWYLNYGGSGNTHGFYYDASDTSRLKYKELLENEVDYLILTNEHNTSMEIDLKKRPYLVSVKSFEYNVNGQDFFANILKLDKEYLE